MQRPKQRPKNFKDLPDKMNVEFVALWLGKSPVMVRRLAKNGTLPATKIGRNWIFDKERLQAMFRA